MGILSGLQSDPKATLIALLYQIPAVLIALTLHELAHGYVALRCGDPTAQMMGRLSFNPLRHLDPMGTLFMFLFGFGWAKPVPVNPRNYRNFRRDDILVSVAGIVMNLCLFLLSAFLIVGVNELLWDPKLWMTETNVTRAHFVSLQEYSIVGYALENGTFQQVSTPLFDYFREYMRTPWLAYVLRFLKGFAYLNLGLALFNLLPVPPLDGYHLLNDVFLRGKLHLSYKTVRYISLGFMALIFLPRFLGLPDILGSGLGTAVDFLQRHVLGTILNVFGLR